MSYTLFISDLHLDPARPEHLAALERLLEEHAGKTDALYVLGDLFEAWIGDDDDAPFNRQAIDAFRRFSDAGSALYFMHGNRDFLLGEQFAAQCGGQLLDEGTVVDLYGTRALLMHGDSLCTLDTAYQQFRALARNPQWQQAMLAKPLEERRAIAQGMRMQSQGNNANKAENIMDVTPEEVVRVMNEAGVKHLIHGHTHRPAVHEVPLSGGTGTRWVLGDWGDLSWWIIADDQGLRLESKEISE
ncbi:UDP-2,3-diacylglucosamine diphosphatase [Alloalcanivorax xenomutans]|jgi:UDP-2,3-diacylglucosamine hydrolase|uniref:UDP-2,3-diacylglucosamine diphosphatase n=1 Tax=Alloalcanivorax xenomutans TaxID=1094342 RepID=UPI0006D5CA47|nr:UDP-2,3-diacylglucosamine diphosphatase [Alloalcanivorax xenomutans]KYZ87874.1 UDP-2,3-diacylglucosamine diphosphatase [Alcanivorax sp. KX64203]MBA4721051.1 UDP-2,3-diacylglucosamine diphosphatase [Alcanivorax sp.]ARB45958.1 UDP-2,3-diacylglucosamine hydrolase [Alloalcanivorax xenomutans]MCE7525671.1 UDP-2,3-diacylglucosamine diphosphatase [Alloalcanivorax xenomutans]PHS56762.1 MAG: UDP-2,3-diacylglucosamine diphosphatase [Alcanivorax sp.]|tara:strand:+ start:68 stop:799 length:732 start_codon:yes stop_codon:yes gene_type:complete